MDRITTEMEPLVFDDAPKSARVIAAVVMISTGAAITVSEWTPVWLGLIIAGLGVTALALRQQLVLNLEVRTWRWETGVLPFVSRSKGVIAELKCIELQRVKVTHTDSRSTSDHYEARLVWNESRPTPKVLYKGSSIRAVAESAAKVGRLTGLPVTQSDELRQYRLSLQDLPMLE
jgi:hypothetical protein